jgi:hypothetical protein
VPHRLAISRLAIGRQAGGQAGGQAGRNRGPQMIQNVLGTCGYCMQSVASQHVGKPINREEGHHRKQHFAHHDTSRLDAHTDRTVAALPDINNKRVTTQRLFSYCCCYVARCSNRWWSIVLCGKKSGESRWLVLQDRTPHRKLNLYPEMTRPARAWRVGVRKLSRRWRSPPTQTPSPTTSARL